MVPSSVERSSVEPKLLVLPNTTYVVPPFSLGAPMAKSPMVSPLMSPMADTELPVALPFVRPGIRKPSVSSSSPRLMTPGGRKGRLRSTEMAV